MVLPGLDFHGCASFKVYRLGLRSSWPEETFDGLRPSNPLNRTLRFGTFASNKVTLRHSDGVPKSPGWGPQPLACTVGVIAKRHSGHSSA